jgi:hypothetical protein
MQRRPRYGTFSEYLTNLNAPYPLPTKIRMILRNGFRRIVLRQLCCGHDGEPGC